MTDPFRKVLLGQILVFALVAIAWPNIANAQQSKPNVVVILTDDQGWGDLSLHGNQNLSTPHIDSIAKEGISFQNFYVCSVCAPTRAEFLTGRYHWRTGVSGVSRGQGRIEPDETILAELFRGAGYATGCFGKWHNGTQSPLHPNDRGFDEFYGFTSGHWGHYFSPPLDHNGTVVRGKGFIVDDLVDHAIEFIEQKSGGNNGQNGDQPFFCYLPINTPHSPMMVDDRFYDKFAEFDPISKHRDPQREDLAMTRAAMAMCENIDWNVGRVLETLRQRGVADNTIVVFFCDNGPNSFRYNGGMKGKKGSLDEGGLRSPLFIRWPGQIRSGQKNETVAAAIDLLPTLMTMAGIDAPTNKPIDGRNLQPLWKTPEKHWASREIYSLWNRRLTVRSQQYRLDSEGRLFDIVQDRGQTNAVTQQFPEVAKSMQRSANETLAAAKRDVQRFADRPFHVGFSASTTLPARDGKEHGTIRRSSKAPNNSFFTHWTSADDSITWDVTVKEAGDYQVTVHYTCPADDVGVNVRASVDEGDSVATTVEVAFDPPLYDKSKERVAKSHYIVKDFHPLLIGELKMKTGRQTLRLSASDFKGSGAIDVHSIVLKRPNSTD